MNSEFTINTTASFNRSVRHLSKKRPSIRNDLVGLRSQLQDNPKSGTLIGKGGFKIRLKIASQKTGKNGGGRVITCVKSQAQRITLRDVSDKPEKEAIADAELTNLLNEAED